VSEPENEPPAVYVHAEPAAAAGGSGPQQEPAEGGDEENGDALD